MSEIKKLAVLPPDKIVKLEISGGFYIRISQLLSSYAQQHSITDLIKLLEELKSREPQTEVEYNLLTLLTLCSSIERAAMDQKLIEFRDLPPHNTEEKPLES